MYVNHLLTIHTVIGTVLWLRNCLYWSPQLGPPHNRSYNTHVHTTVHHIQCSSICPPSWCKLSNSILNQHSSNLEWSSFHWTEWNHYWVPGRVQTISFWRWRHKWSCSQCTYIDYNFSQPTWVYWVYHSSKSLYSGRIWTLQQWNSGNNTSR